MNTVIEKLNKLKNTKEAIRRAINSKGGKLTKGNKFSTYATAINKLTIDDDSGDGPVNILKPIYEEKKDPVPNTGYLKSIFFNTKLTPDQVETLITNAVANDNLTLVDMGDATISMPVYPILATESGLAIAIIDFFPIIQATKPDSGIESGPVWLIWDMGSNGAMYYVSPKLAAIGSQTSEPMPTGWVADYFTDYDTGEVAIESNLMSETQPDPSDPSVPILTIGAQNNLLTDLVRLYALVDSGETELANSLTGQYKLVEKDIVLDPAANPNYTYGFENSVDEDTKEISVIRNIKVSTKVNAIINKSVTTYTNNKVRTIGQYAFYSCNKLTDADFPKATTIDNYAFSYCSMLANINIPLATNIGQMAFNNCYSLVKVFISQKESVCSHCSDAFTNCYHILGTTDPTYNPGGLKDGYIYVPASLLTNYKRSWSSELTTQIIGHEDLEAGTTLPNYTDSDFTKQTWYSNEKLTTAVTSVATSGTYYCRLEA